jgi:hypothetical protein
VETGGLLCERWQHYFKCKPHAACTLRCRVKATISHRELMLATSASKPFDRAGWLFFELKYDGFRVLAIREGDEGRLLSRRGNNLGVAGHYSKRSSRWITPPSQNLPPCSPSTSLACAERT